jgi:regulator of sirC expression with transglutaminase-like and TPR domain
MTGVPLESVALAMAAEFRPVESGRTEARLDLIAAELGCLSGLPVEERARAMLAFLDERVGLRARTDRDPEALMLDRAIDERCGHPYALALIHAAVGRRCGLELFPVLAGRALLLADRGGDRTVVIDPLPGGRTLSCNPGWICPHVVAVMLLDAVGSRYLERGDIARAIRAGELRLELPLDSEARQRHEHELRGLRAHLN